MGLRFNSYNQPPSGGFLLRLPQNPLPTKRNQQRLMRIIQHLRIIPNPIHGRQIPSMNRRALRWHIQIIDALIDNQTAIVEHFVVLMIG